MVVATGIGAALFFVLMRFVAVPSGIPNTTLNLAYAILALFAG
ncbi:MAG: ECF transporter S component, partial [Eubacteriales bacterium]|nr:ECF transporter S component [Eubacteriales bacterium]